MDTFSVPSEKDFKNWIREAMKECLEDYKQQDNVVRDIDTELLNRKETAKRLQISLVTLTDWVKRGLPSHKQRGRVYFIYSEVMDYIKKNRLRQHLKYF